MTRRSPMHFQSPWSRFRHIHIGLALAIDAALIAAAFFAFSYIGQHAPRAEAASTTATKTASTASTLPGPTPRPRSPLERSPGYYAPADPESASVDAGRRNAPAVSLELEGGATSIRILARQFLAAIHARDERALHALRLTRHEFGVICWPEFPQSRPVTRLTADDAWEFSVPTSLAGAGRTIALYGGRPLDLVHVDEDRVEAYHNFSLHRDVVIVARDASDNSLVSLRFAPSIVERHGRFKALLFKD
jgi:hypothetical protein